MSPEEARRQAILKFGAIEATREAWRDQRSLPFFETLLSDTRLALRRLRNAPAFTFTAILTLALAIGATTAIFTLVYAVALKSLAVANPDQLLRLGKESRCCYWGGYSQAGEFSIVSYDLYKYLRDHTHGFSELAAFQAGGSGFGARRSGTSDPAHPYPGEFVSGNYFRMFGVNAYAGRLLVPSDDQPHSAPVAVMSYRLWQERYGSDPSVIGSIFDLNNKPVAIVGIAPPGFFGDKLRDASPDFFVPLNQAPYLEPANSLNEISTHWLDLIGRIQPGIRSQSVEASMRVALKQWLRSHWSEMTANERTEFDHQTLFLMPGGSGITSMRDQYNHWLEILMLVTALVLLIACANIANLLLVRAIQHRRQISLSMALGARPARLVRQTLTESLLLAISGGIAGLVVAFFSTHLILQFVFPRIPGLAAIPIDASPSLPVLLFAFGVSMLTGIGFGIVPAWLATRIDPIEALRGANRAIGDRATLPRQSLVVFQAALSLVLLSASGLLFAALHHLEHLDLGFDADRRTVVNIDAKLAGYQPDQLTRLYRRIRESLASVPGVAAVGIGDYSPMNGNNWSSAIAAEGRPAPGPNDNSFASVDRVTPGFLEAIGNPIVSGRSISERDTDSSPLAAVVNQAFAAQFFPHQNAIGRHFGIHGPGSEHEYEIVGIARNARYVTYGLDRPVAPFYFRPEAQHDRDPQTGFPEVDPTHYLHDIVITSQPGAHVSETQIRKALAKVDPNLPVIAVFSLSYQISSHFRQQRLIARLTSFFGLLSLALCCIGLYGVTAYNATQRTAEIGIRMALGADRAEILQLVFRGAVLLVGLGLLAGLPLAWASGSFLGKQLYGTDPHNLWVISIAVAALSLSAAIAALLPALRASSISPLDALRSE